MFKKHSVHAVVIGGVVLGLCALIAQTAEAGDHPIGQPVEINGMTVASAYIQAVEMDPMDDICGPAEADIHLTAQIHALPGNGDGLAAGQWVPGLLVTYDLTRRGSDFHSQGILPPMIAQGGPHYGHNMKLDGPGRYHLTLQVAPPSGNGFLRMISAKENGQGWWQSFRQDWDFVFVGSPGKKGGY